MRILASTQKDGKFVNCGQKRSPSSLWIAIPDSLTSESPHLREKTVKVGQIARACAIFRVSKILLYHDRQGGGRDEARITRTILEYIETPQYLRKHLFRKMEELSYAGLLYPLRTPHHKLEVPPNAMKRGEVREGVTLRMGGKSYAYVGVSQNVPLLDDIIPGQRATIRIEQEYPRLIGKIVGPEEVGDYWGFEVEEYPGLLNLVEKVNADFVIITSRKGRPLGEIWQSLTRSAKEASELLVVFGSPRRGVHEILEEEGGGELEAVSVNIFPDQGVATIRTEEALLGTLAVLNFMRAANL